MVYCVCFVSLSHSPIFHPTPTRYLRVQLAISKSLVNVTPGILMSLE